MAGISEPIVINGFAWVDDSTSEVVWAYQEELQGVKPADRPDGCTPVIIEISPVDNWVAKKEKEHEFLGDVSEQLSKFKTDLSELTKSIKLQE